MLARPDAETGVLVAHAFSSLVPRNGKITQLRDLPFLRLRGLDALLIHSLSTLAICGGTYDLSIAPNPY